MNTSQLRYCKERYFILKRWVYLCAADRLPSSLEFLPCAIIVNTDPNDRPGKHWCVFHFGRNPKGDFSDSFWHPPDYYAWFASYLCRHATHVSAVNSTRLHSDYLWIILSLVSSPKIPAGAYIWLFYAIWSENYCLDDLFVLDMFTKSFPYCIKAVCVYNQSCA